MSVFLRMISLITKNLIVLLKFIGKGGTALPGLWVERYFPSLISQYAKHYKKIIFITGTNGKTTVQLALGKVLESVGYTVTGNFSGSNMLRGIATILLTAGVPPRSANTILLCEVEEATMPVITKYIKPHLIIITNVFRDQLDAYGELDKTAEYIMNACHTSPDATLVLNGDDPVIAEFTKSLSHKKVTYSLGAYAQEFQYETTPLTETQIAHSIARSIQVNNDLSTESCIESRGKTIEIKFRPPGIYNVYNALAAFTAAQELGMKAGDITTALARVQPPFGRGETVTLQKDGKHLTFQIFLVKNPAGYSQVWELLRTIKTPFDLLLGLNDNIADGRDVSWIWDIALTPFTHPNSSQAIAFTGRRAYDMALRLKYAEIYATSQNIIPDISSCLEDVIQKSTDGRPTLVLMTYTAMNQFRSELGKYVTLSPYTS